ncbi:Uncharacterised protein [Mycobacteroides abscessus subsp. abscessus]|nr:Uncharacterised protein [Mycobacteroides abscessus subsp. abscessus]
MKMGFFNRILFKQAAYYLCIFIDAMEDDGELPLLCFLDKQLQYFKIRFQAYKGSTLFLS